VKQKRFVKFSPVTMVDHLSLLSSFTEYFLVVLW